MAGETALSSNSSQGIYLLADNNGWVAANTPNTCNLGGDTGLVLGTSYMYFDDFLSLKETAVTPDTKDNSGWEIIQDGTTLLKTKAIAGQGVIRGFVLNVQIDSTQQSNWVKFFDVNQYRDSHASSYQCYLVRQWAATTFREFSYNATKYKYVAIIINGYELVEAGREGKDIQSLAIQMTHAYRKNPSG